MRERVPAESTEMKKVMWGVLSTAKIGREKVIPGMQKGYLCDVVGIASRSLKSAEAVAKQLSIPRAYGSYEELLADPEIEAVYNPLPNDLHVPMTLAAARAGKHVLCEKPIALNASEAAALREVADRVHIMEAFMVRFHPQWIRAQEMAMSGALGRLHTIQVFFSYNNVDSANIRNRVETGGGALYDIGCYAVVAGRMLFGCEPLRVVSLLDRDPRFGTDRLTSALLDFGQGRHLQFTVSTQSVPYQRVQIFGTSKRLEVEIPFNAIPEESLRLHLDDGSLLGGRAATTESVPACDQYTLQGDVFSEVIRGIRPPPYGIEDGVQNMRVIDAIFESARVGGWTTVPA